MVATNINTRVQKHRASLRASGLRPIQIWVPDTRIILIFWCRYVNPGWTVCRRWRAGRGFLPAIN